MSIVDKNGVKVEPAGRGPFNPWPVLFAWADADPQQSEERWRHLVALGLEAAGWNQHAIKNALGFSSQGAVSKLLVRAKAATRAALEPAMKAAELSQLA